MDEKTIRITCKGATEVALDELHDLQGNLKELSVENYHKLKQSILEYGFSFPVFLWIDPEGKKWVIDSHQRGRVLRKLRDEEGYIIPLLPADIIEARDKTEAKEKILLLLSSYGKPTEEGLNEFVHESDSPIDLPHMELILDVPNLNIEYAKPELPEEKQEKEPITCPNCKYVFHPDEV